MTNTLGLLMQRLGTVTLVTMVALLGATLLPPAAATASAAGNDGARFVYTLSNRAAGNEVLVFERDRSGALQPAGSVPTGGLGTGAALGSQGALILGGDNRMLFAVNAGSNDVSVLRVRDDGLTVLARVPSGGARPVSLTVSRDVLYVLNAGGTGNIAGFRVSPRGDLAPIANSIRPLSSPAAGPAQIQFSPDGRQLVVTEKATNRIVTYAVTNGVAASPVVHPSNGSTPFGFDFGNHGTLIVSEPGGAASSYHVTAEGAVTLVTPSLSTHQGATCWVVVTENGRFAYATNAAAGSISGFAVDNEGVLTLLDADGRTGVTGGTPIDMALSSGSRALYALSAATGQISGFQVASDGSLTPTGPIGGLPTSSVGLVAQ